MSRETDVIEEQLKVLKRIEHRLDILTDIVFMHVSGNQNGEVFSKYQAGGHLSKPFMKDDDEH